MAADISNAEVLEGRYDDNITNSSSFTADGAANIGSVVHGAFRNETFGLITANGDGTKRDGTNGDRTNDNGTRRVVFCVQHRLLQIDDVLTNRGSKNGTHFLYRENMDGKEEVEKPKHTWCSLRYCFPECISSTLNKLSEVSF